MQIKTVVPVCIICWFVLSCKSVSTVPPEWIGKPPPSDTVYEYFTATGTGCGSRAADTAYRYAMDAVLLQVGRYVGSSISLTTETAGTIAADTATIETQTTIREKSAAYIEYCKVIETFTHPKAAGDDCLRISLLVRFDKAALAAERARLAALEQEKEASVNLPEKEADAYAAAGQPYKALLRYIEAARAASQTDMDNADIKYDRTVKKAREMLTRIKMRADTSVPINAVSNAPFPVPFTVHLFTDTIEGEVTLAEIPLVISYTSINPKTGRKSIPVQKTVSTADGNAVFIHPVQSRPYENGQVVFMLDSEAILSPLRSVKGPYKRAIRLLEEAAAACKVQFLYNVS